MTRLKLLLCAEGVVVDQRTNNASVFTILEELSPQELPSVLPQFVILALFERDEEEPETREFRLTLSLNDESIFGQDMKLDFKGKRRMRQMVHLGGVSIEKPGTFVTSVALGDQAVGEWNITVNPPKKPIVKEQTGAEE